MRNKALSLPIEADHSSLYEVWIVCENLVKHILVDCDTNFILSADLSEKLEVMHICGCLTLLF